MDWDKYDEYYKLFADPIHGYMKMNSICLKFIDTPQFQRLHELKQLGTLSYIFSTATHTRFPHSLGVAHLAGNIVNRYKQEQPELQLTNREVNLVKLAGLCHDLGHGPFSHVFDNIFINKYIGNTTYTHEQMSLNMLDYLIDDNNIDIDRNDINFIKNLIGSKDCNKNYNNEFGYLFEIVANSNNCIDVDKFDYLSRDMHNLFGTSKTYNFKRIYEFNRVIDNNICYNNKVLFDIYDLFRQRYDMHRQVYNHKKAKAVEYMVGDILLHANDILKISKSIENVEDFLYMNDSIINTIKISKDKNLNKSKDIIKRLQKRQLYTYIHEYVVPKELIDKFPSINKIDITTNSNTNINPDDIIIYDNKINYNYNNKNPIDNVYFYNSNNSNIKYKQKKENISLLFPQYYEDRVLRIYSRNTNTKINEEIKNAFIRYLKQF